MKITEPSITATIRNFYTTSIWSYLSTRAATTCLQSLSFKKSQILMQLYWQQKCLTLDFCKKDIVAYRFYTANHWELSVAVWALYFIITFFECFTESKICVSMDCLLNCNKFTIVIFYKKLKLSSFVQLRKVF